jgi:hypothetical protein
MYANAAEDGDMSCLHLHTVCAFFCMENTPVRKMLDIWPSLPIEVWTFGAKSPTDNAIAALEHPDRICGIWLFETHPPLEHLITAMQGPFPALELFYLDLEMDAAPPPALPKSA